MPPKGYCQRATGGYSGALFHDVWLHRLWLGLLCLVMDWGPVGNRCQTEAKSVGSRLQNHEIKSLYRFSRIGEEDEKYADVHRDLLRYGQRSG